MLVHATTAELAMSTPPPATAPPHPPAAESARRRAGPREPRGDELPAEDAGEPPKKGRQGARRLQHRILRPLGRGERGASDAA